MAAFDFRRAAGVVILTVLVAALHGVIVRALTAAVSAPAPSPAASAVRTAAMAVRQVDPPPAPPAAAVPPVPRPRRGTVGIAPAPAATATTAPAPLVPPPLQWRYAVRQGTLTGQALLDWQPRGERYTARLAARGEAAAWFDWRSEGGFDAAGLAPLRHVAQGRRQAHAANFQRERGVITYSGPSHEHPLLPGAQDRLSAIVQLAAILAASPGRFAAAGSEVALHVSGARGEADTWRFVAMGAEPMARPDGRVVAALHFVREPVRPYDLRVALWLDPEAHHLPLRLRFDQAGRDAPLELLLDGVVPPR